VDRDGIDFPALPPNRERQVDRDLLRGQGAEGAADGELLAAARGEGLVGAGAGGVGLRGINLHGLELGGARTSHQAPSLAIFFVERFASAVGIKAQAFAGGEGVDGDDVPQIFGDDPGDEEVDLVASVGGLPSGGFDAVARLGVALGGFDLNAPEIAVSGVEEEVVALAVSPRLGDAESQAGGFSEEGGLGGFSATLAGGEADGVDFEFVQR
jgi:hypothetical protein